MQKKLENEIVHLIDLYESSTSFSTRNYYYNSIINLIDVYQDLTKKTIMFSPHFKDILYDSHLDKKINRTWINEVSSKNYRNMIDEICNNGIEIIDDNIKLEEQSFTDEISFKSACEIIYSFFEKYDKTLLPFVKNILENNLVFCQTDLEKLGYSINSRSLKKTYIVIFSDKNRISIEKLITIIHEIGHALYNKTLNSKKMHSTHNDFVETIPYFLEQVFIGYCTKNKIHAIDCLKAQKNDIIGLYNYLIDLKITNRFITKVNIRNLSLKLSLNDLTKIEDYDFSNDTLTLKDCDKNYEYSYGLLLAFYYLNSYNQDPEKTKESIKQFMLNIGIYNDQYILNHFGIVYDDLLSCEFLKPIIIENQKQLSKKPHN